MRRVGGEHEEEVGTRRVEHRRQRRQRPRRRRASRPSAAASGRGSATPTIATGSPMVWSRRIAGIHFACATPPQPAIARRSGRLRRARRVGADAVDVAAGEGGVDAGMAEVDWGPGGHRAAARREKTPAARARSVSAARMIVPLIRKNCASPICRPERPLLRMARKSTPIAVSREPAGAAAEGRAAEDHRDDGVELEAEAGGRRRGAEAAEHHDHAERGEAAHDEEDHERAGCPRRRRPGAACADRRRRRRCGGRAASRRRISQPARKASATSSSDTVKPSDDRRVHQRDEAHVEGDRRGVGQRDREAARPDPGGERDDQRVEAEAADDQRRSAHRPRGRRRCRRASASGTGTPGLTASAAHDGAERDHRAGRDVDRARDDADHRADRDDRQRRVLLDQRHEVRPRREARVDRRRRPARARRWRRRARSGSSRRRARVMPAKASVIASPAGRHRRPPRWTRRPATIAARRRRPVTVVCQVPGTPRMVM